MNKLGLILFSTIVLCQLNGAFSKALENDGQSFKKITLEDNSEVQPTTSDTYLKRVFEEMENAKELNGVMNISTIEEPSLGKNDFREKYELITDNGEENDSSLSNSDSNESIEDQSPVSNDIIKKLPIFVLNDFKISDEEKAMNEEKKWNEELHLKSKLSRLLKLLGKFLQ